MNFELSSKNINVRKKPTTESNIIGTAVAGEEYEYIETEENGWIHLKLPDGMGGFVSGKMASVIPDKDPAAISNEGSAEERIINEEAEESLNDRFVLYRDVPSMPEPNIDKEINFKGIKWWSDFNTVVDARKKIGFQNFREFSSGVMDVRHWIYGLSNNYDGYELFSRCRAYFCGGQISFYNRVSSDNPQVAGHVVDKVELFFMVNPEKGNLQDYKKKGVLQFYMAKYTFAGTSDAYNLYGGNGSDETYFDLLKKLRTQEIII